MMKWRLRAGRLAGTYKVYSAARLNGYGEERALQRPIPRGLVYLHAATSHGFARRSAAAMAMIEMALNRFGIV